MTRAGYDTWSQLMVAAEERPLETGGCDRVRC
jgi:hypothetical protein